MATLKEVARAAGVSAASASRVLGGGLGVSPALRTRVMSAAARLGYQPNLAARALASRSGPVGIVVANLADPLLVAVAKAVAGALAAHGVGSFVNWAPGGGLATHGPEGRRVRALVGVGGLPKGCGKLSDTLPCIGITDDPGEGCRGIELGRLRGFALACRYLENEGHRRMAAVAAVDLVKAQPFAETPGDASVSVEPVGAGPPGVNEAVRRMLPARGRPTAIVCDSDLAAVAVLRACVAAGIEVPGEVSVVGFGDESFARYTIPGLTTVRVSAAQIGATAAQAIVDLASGRDPSLQAAVVKLVLRESSGPAS